MLHLLNKRIRLWLLLFGVVMPLAGAAQETKPLPDQVVKIIEQVKAEYCPDKRISIFDVNIRKEGEELIVKGEVLDPQAKKDLMSRLMAKVKYHLVDSLLVLPHANVGKNKWGIVRISVAQLRRGPDIDYEIINQAIMGSEVSVLKKRGMWVYCQLEDGYLGWMMISSLALGDDEVLSAWRKRPKLIVVSNCGSICETPSEECSRLVSDVVLGNKFYNLGVEGGWYHAELPDGRQGYIQAKLVLELDKFETQAKATPENLVRLAYRFMGIPYFWGGISTKGFDCSGFTQTIYKMNGILLPRDANMQVHSGTAVEIDESLSNLKIGDLLFFGKNINRITHVGMYLGDGKFIHSDGMVHINSFNPQDETYDEYRREGLQAVRRILQE